uniref:serine protease inhibitor Kazal-type 1 isoform X1 n=1 Tax=Halichoerus grypus TaxID=9711 RepID=UPI001659A028|nr:serine protease inhibitor Kazal-type 1 isoform X1 [Halichoerus grypus]
MQTLYEYIQGNTCPQVTKTCISEPFRQSNPTQSHERNTVPATGAICLQGCPLWSQDSTKELQDIPTCKHEPCNSLRHLVSPMQERGKERTLKEDKRIQGPVNHSWKETSASLGEGKAAGRGDSGLCQQGRENGRCSQPCWV